MTVESCGVNHVAVTRERVGSLPVFQGLAWQEIGAFAPALHGNKNQDIHCVLAEWGTILAQRLLDIAKRNICIMFNNSKYTSCRITFAATTNITIAIESAKENAGKFTSFSP
jgi:hypothetical protein